MLEEINIQNLGIIKKANLNFTKGLTVITGETGAGKTMVLSALHLLLGKRANSSSIATNTTHLSVEGCWNTDNANIIKSIEETGAIVEDGQIFINRTIKADGKSRAVIGGKSTPASTLSRIGESLVSIHGQSDQIRLKSPTAQRNALDQYARKELDKTLNTYRKLFQNWTKQQEEIKDISQNSAAKKREINSLKTFIKEYDDLAPQDNENEEISKQIDTLSNIDEIRQNMNEAYQAVNSDNDEMLPVSTQLDTFIRLLRPILEYDNDIKELSEKASEINETFNELLDQTETYLNTLDADSLEQLYQLQERELELKSFVKKHGNSLQEVIQQRIIAEQTLQELDKYSLPIEELEEELEKAYNKMIKEAQKITKIRQSNAEKMATEVNKELSGLSMDGHTLVIDIKETKPNGYGTDEVNIGLRSKGSQKVGSISKTASGGELSRIMLALEVVLADPENTGTFVFDEVDSGVGGETAIEIGKRLATLAKETQVIVVTHLPQVAAYADNHLKVSKTVHEESIETKVTQLNDKETQDEITRMLSGMTNSDLGKAHAKELLEHASKFKNAL